MNKPTIYLHCRVSTEKQEDTQGLPNQEKRGRIIFSQREDFKDYQIVVRKEIHSAILVEELEDRPYLVETLNLLNSGDIIWFDHDDRVSKNNKVKKEIIKAILKKGARLFIASKEYNLKSPQDLFLLGILGEVDEFYAFWQTLKMREGKDRAIFTKGVWLFTAPYGYKKDKDKKLIPDPEEKKIYDRIVDWSLEGKGTNTIARMLNELEIPSRKQMKWKAGVVLGILKNPIYKGEVFYKEHKLKFPALISAEKWQIIQSNLKRNYKSGNAERFYLLRGLLYCKKCGRRLFGKIKPSSHERLYCCLSKRPDPEPRFCGLRSINLDKVEQLVWQRSREIALNTSKLKEVIESQRDNSYIDGVELEVQIADLDKLIASKDKEVKDIIRQRNKYKSLSDEEIDKIISEIKSEKNNLLIRRHELEDKLQMIEVAKTKVKQINNYLKAISENIDNFNDQKRYDFLRSLIDKIMVDWDSQAKEHIVEIVFGIPLEQPHKDIPPTLIPQYRVGYQDKRFYNSLQLSVKERVK